MKYVLIFERFVTTGPGDDSESFEQHSFVYGPFDSVEDATKYAVEADFVGTEGYICHETLPLLPVRA